MEPSEIEKTVKEFLAKVKPVTAEMMAKEGVTPEELPGAVAVEAVAEAPPLPKPEACITKGFKNTVSAFTPEFIGKDGKDIKDLVIAFLDSLPECKE